MLRSKMIRMRRPRTPAGCERFPRAVSRFLPGFRWMFPLVNDGSRNRELCTTRPVGRLLRDGSDFEAELR
jgi:hypothetical protein